MPNIEPETPLVHVAVGVILDKNHNVLISRRAPKAHQGDLWEFPGGKVESAETVLEALHRELIEELDITIGRTTPLIEIQHNYGDKSVLLDVHIIWDFANTPRSMEQQPLAWVEPSALAQYEFPAANVPIIPALLEVLHLNA